MTAGSYRVCKMSTSEEAGRIVEFFFSPDSFDDTRHTPGEEEQFRTLPYLALEGKAIFWYATNEQGEIIGVNCVSENEQRTGGYIWDYLVVHREHRNSGVASSLIDEMLLKLQQLQVRYLIGYTCSLPEYRTIRSMLVHYGFRKIGKLPDYYFEGEDRLIYYRKIS